jgi:NADPH:quinone reductase-like Zn-dependent oxidoreductase
MPTELSWYPTTHDQAGGKRTGAVPGHEFSGVVEAAGEDVGRLEIGREVFGMNDWFADGAMADFCVAPFFAVAPKPQRLSHVEAASVPISALTAWQGLFGRCGLQPGERVLVHGGAGAVGTFAIQLARLHGARVTATASAEGAQLASRLGAEQVIDYRTQRFEECVHDMDVVLDTVGGETLERSWAVLRPGGRLATIVETVPTAEPRAKQAFFIVEPNQKQLYAVAALLDEGRLETIVDAVVPLVEAPNAYTVRPPGPHHGKTVVAVAPA